jgi:hypothetical protein
MASTGADSPKHTPRTVYRLEVEGPVGSEWADWFGADAVIPAGSGTILEVHVADQAELFGRLRRIHDMNLRLVSVTRRHGGEG